MSRGARSVGAHLITISTDYVFDGNKGRRYVEMTRPTRSMSMARPSAPVSCSAQNHDTIVRTSWVMGVRGKNVAHVIAERALGGAGCDS